jgi:hypothetical protein
MEGFWVKWPPDRDPAAAYEVHLAPSGFEAVLYVKDPAGEGEAIAAIDNALANALGGLTAAGLPSPRPRNLEDVIACVHVEMTNGSVSIGWGNPTAEERIGTRAEVRALLLQARNDLAQRQGGRKAG